MRIRFHLEWLKGNSISFKEASARELFSEYTKRISKFTACEIGGAWKQGVKESGGRKLWLCDRGVGAKILSSEDLANQLGRVLDSGVQQLGIVIGGADGFSGARLAEINAELRWSFGPLTLPHELAAVVAAEQVYRAWCQLRNLPYHRGH